MICFILSSSGFTSVVTWEHLKIFIIFLFCEEKQREREEFSGFLFSEHS